MSEQTPYPLKERRIRCGQCGFVLASHDQICPQCGQVPDPSPASETALLKHRPTTLARDPQGKTFFAPEAKAILQFLPSGVCLPLDIHDPVVLGRGDSAEDDLLDLSDLNALRHGVSRRHCLLQRHNHLLLVTDLKSYNGTMLNGELIPPFEEHILAHGDELILGSLRLLVTFTTLDIAEFA